MLQEFKAFAIRGNVIDLAVGVIIGGAFGKIVDSMVGDLIMPMVSALIGRLDFSNLFIALGAVPAGTGSTLDALRKAGVKFDLHIYQKGPHGIGLSVGKNGAKAGEVHPWASDLLVWLRQNQWAK
jgi:hypothetical protein